MGNNIRELRLAFLLTPKELARRMGTYPLQVRRLEEAGRKLSDEWIEAVAEALGVPAAAVTDPKADIKSIVAAAGAPSPSRFVTCPIAARFAIQAMAARLGGMKLALALTEDDLATAVRNLVAYVDAEPDAGEAARAIRLSQALQIVVLAILQSHGVSLDPRQLQAVSHAESGASSLILEFSRIDPSDF